MPQTCLPLIKVEPRSTLSQSRNSRNEGVDLDGTRQERLWRVGIDGSALREYQAKSAGNLLYYLLDDDGAPTQKVAALNDSLVCSITLQGLQRLVERGKWVELIAVGKHKARIVRAAALKGGDVNVLIICDDLADAIVEGEPSAAS